MLKHRNESQHKQLSHADVFYFHWSLNGAENIQDVIYICLNGDGIAILQQVRYNSNCIFSVKITRRTDFTQDTVYYL